MAQLLSRDSILRMESEWIVAPKQTQVLSGEEGFLGCNARVLDFWRFAMSDLRMNNVRGYVAEFLVAEAVGAKGPRIEWDAYDILSPDGVRIEVKSAAYLQAWDQPRLSRIGFSGLRGRTWTPRDGESSEATYNADVYVFALQSAETHEQYNALDLSQWHFWVLPRATVETLGQNSIGYSALVRLAPSELAYDELAEAISAAAVVAAGGSQ